MNAYLVDKVRKHKWIRDAFLMVPLYLENGSETDSDDDLGKDAYEKLVDKGFNPKKHYLEAMEIREDCIREFIQEKKRKKKDLLKK